MSRIKDYIKKNNLLSFEDAKAINRIAEAMEALAVDNAVDIVESKISEFKLKRTPFKESFNIPNYVQGHIGDIGDVLNFIRLPDGMIFKEKPVTGISPYDCHIDSNIYDVIEHVALAASKLWYINDSKEIIFIDFPKEESND